MCSTNTIRLQKKAVDVVILLLLLLLLHRTAAAAERCVEKLPTSSSSRQARVGPIFLSHSPSLSFHSYIVFGSISESYCDLQGSEKVATRLL
jgi:hypothetical protein